MSEFIINVIDSSDVVTTFYPDVGFEFSDPLNNVGEAQLNFSSLGLISRNNITLGNHVQIIVDGTTEFYGLVDYIDNLDGGGYAVHCSTYDIWLAKENGDYSNSPYSSTASATIVSEIIAESSYLTAGTIDTGVDIDFRMAQSDSLLNNIGNLITKTGQDYELDYTDITAVEIDIIDHRGSSTSVATLNNPEISNMRVARTYPGGNKIIVYGKGDGDNQIKSEYPSHGYDATSQGTYGVIERPVIDSTIISVDEANILADIEVATTKDEQKTYFFTVNDTNTTAVTGDIITLNSEEHDLSDEEVRIVKITKGVISGTEFLKYQVTNASNSKVLKLRDRNIADLRKQQRDTSTYMQGSGNTNTWGLGINAKTGASAKVKFYLPEEYLFDEAGNNNVNLFTVSYDLDPFLKQYGTASFDGSDPQVQNDSGDEGATVGGDSGSTSPMVTSGDSGEADPDVDYGDSSYAWKGSYIGYDSDSSVSCASGSWTTLASVSTTNTDKQIAANFYVKGVSGGPEDIQIKIKNSGEVTTNDAHFGIAQGDFDDDNFCQIYGVNVGENDYSDTISLQVKPNGAIVLGGYLYVYEVSHEHSYGDYRVADHDHDDGDYAVAGHTHDDGDFAAADHSHGDGTYEIDNADLDDISIGDGLSESASLSSSSVNLYLDYYSAGAWVNKHSILTTGVTIDEDVDISNSGTYPDAAGWWRVRVEPITTSGDFAQAIVKIKNNIDN